MDTKIRSNFAFAAYGQVEREESCLFVGRKRRGSWACGVSGEHDGGECVLRRGSSCDSRDVRL